VLGISGGDGSIGAVAKVALAHDLPMVVLPGGTRCHFARDLGMNPKRIVDSLAAFKGVERRVDVGVINRHRVFLNNVSFGLYADIVDHPGYRDHKMRVSYEVMHSIANGSTVLYDLQFQSGSRQVKRAAEVLVGVDRYDFVDLFELGHRERLDEGVLQITALTELNNQVVKNLLRASKVDKLREHLDDTGLLQWTNRSFTLTNAHHTIVAGVDGEREQYNTPITIRILPKALRVYVPAEGIRHRPKNAFSEPVLRRVWWGALH
jgi:diacylglycerol kinase family enzyme